MEITQIGAKGETAPPPKTLLSLSKGPGKGQSSKRENFQMLAGRSTPAKQDRKNWALSLLLPTMAGGGELNV